MSLGRRNNRRCHCRHKHLKCTHSHRNSCRNPAIVAVAQQVEATIAATIRRRPVGVASLSEVPRRRRRPRKNSCWPRNADCQARRQQRRQLLLLPSQDQRRHRFRRRARTTGRRSKCCAEPTSPHCRTLRNARAAIAAAFDDAQPIQLGVAVHAALIRSALGALRKCPL